MIDSTIIRAHQHAAGQKKRCRNRSARPKPRWVLDAKVSVVCDALGNPLAFRLTPGQRHEITQAKALLEDTLPKEQVPSDQQRQKLRAVLGDRGYDSKAFIECVESMGAEAVIPNKKNRTEPRQIDQELYKNRNKVERFIAGSNTTGGSLPATTSRR